MRLIPKRLSAHIVGEPRRKKPPKKQYSEMVSDTEDSSDDSDEVTTPRNSGSNSPPTVPEIFADFQGSRGNFVRTMRIIKSEHRKTTIMDVEQVKSLSDIHIPMRRTRSVLTTTPPSRSSFLSPSSVPSPVPSPYSFPLLTDDQKMKARAIYVASRVKQHLKDIFDGVQLRTWGNPAPEVSSVDMTQIIADRLYTYAHLCANRTPEHDRILAQLDADLERSGDSLLASRRAGREAHYAMRYTLDRFFRESVLPSQKSLMVECTRRVMERCIESEEKLSPSERDCMYAFHRLMSGVRWDERDVQISLGGMTEC